MSLNGSKVEKSESKKSKKLCGCGPKTPKGEKILAAASISGDFFQNDVDSTVKTENSDSCCSSDKPASSLLKKSKHEVITIQGVVNQHFVEVGKNGTRILSEEDIKRAKSNKVYSFISENPGKEPSRIQQVSASSTPITNTVTFAKTSLSPNTPPQEVHTFDPSEPVVTLEKEFCCCGSDDCDCANCEGCQLMNSLGFGDNSFGAWPQEQVRVSPNDSHQYWNGINLGSGPLSDIPDTITNNHSSHNVIPDLEPQSSRTAPQFVNSFLGDFEKKTVKDGCCSSRESSLPTKSCCSSKQPESKQVPQTQRTEAVSKDEVSQLLTRNNKLSLEFSTSLELPSIQALSTSRPDMGMLNAPPLSSAPNKSAPNFILPMNTSLDDALSNIFSKNSPDDPTFNNMDSSQSGSDLADLPDLIALLERKRVKYNDLMSYPSLEMSVAPSCVLPGQCRCGEDCKCPGCSTHRNGVELENLDFQHSIENSTRPLKTEFELNDNNNMNIDIQEGVFSQNLMDFSMNSQPKLDFDNTTFQPSISSSSSNFNMSALDILNDIRINGSSSLNGVNTNMSQFVNQQKNIMNTISSQPSAHIPESTMVTSSSSSSSQQVSQKYDMNHLTESQPQGFNAVKDPCCQKHSLNAPTQHHGGQKLQFAISTLQDLMKSGDVPSKSVADVVELLKRQLQESTNSWDQPSGSGSNLHTSNASSTMADLIDQQPTNSSPLSDMNSVSSPLSPPVLV